MFITEGALTSSYDCYVIGAGPAGITVALELAKASKNVLLFESAEADAVRTDLPEAINFGHLPGGWWSRHSVRAFGGTSTVWGGWIATLGERDFDNPATGVSWPITRNDLVPYYKSAAGILDRSPSVVDFERALLPGFVYRPFSVNEEGPTRFGPKYRSELERSERIHVAFGYSVVGMDAVDGRSSVKTLSCFHHASGATQQLTLTPSQTVVVAGGGIGNAQLLIQPRADGAVPVGNESGHAGRFLMEHPHFVEAVECVLDVNLDVRRRPPDFGTAVHSLVPDDALMLKHGLRACSVDCKEPRPDQDVARYMTEEYRKTFFHYHGTIRSEMLPSASNRVFLTGERDRSGFYVHAVRCVLDAEDFLIAETTLRLLGEALIAHRRGRVRINNDRIYREPTGGGHLMGTTRMGVSRKTSVVDRDCRVHGYRNLYVAGSSVFPTSGYANPTLTIVALAVRLAEHLAARN